MATRSRKPLPEVDPFAMPDLHLLALLRASNMPNFDVAAARESLEALQRDGFLKDKRSRWSSVPWWSLTPKGRAATRAFALDKSGKRDAFLHRMYGKL